VEGHAVTFSYASRASNLDGQRTASASGYANQVEIVIPVFHSAANGSGVTGGLDELWADTPTGGTGVEVDSEPLTLMDTNRGGRAWCQIA
jgi:hypothetical protein